MQLLIGTGNKGKVMEIAKALAGLPLDIRGAGDLGITDAPAEEGLTYAENARIKARHYYQLTGLPTLADDSGIVVSALAGELGIHTRRWGAGPQATDAEWVSFFLERMRHETDKRAQFLCALHFVDAEGRDHAFEGVNDGTITEDLEASYLPGLPLSACFRPEGFTQVYSALDVAQKNAVSHRGRAVQAFRRFLESTLP